MKRLFTVVSTAAIVFFCSCQKEWQSVSFGKNDSLILTAGLEQPLDSKTSVQNDGSVFWEFSEEIKVFCNGKSTKFTSMNESPSATAFFKGEGISPKNGDEIWALYPYDEDATFSDGVITTTIPSEQVACAGTFARNTNVTVARSTGTDLQFYNVCGGVRFSLTQEGVKKVIFEGLDGETIAGKVKVGLDGKGMPEIREVMAGHMFITLTPPDGNSFEPGQWYYITSLPGTLSKGFKIRFYTESTYGKFILKESRTIKRSVFGMLKDIDKSGVFETAITHYPETDSEIKTSIDLMNEISSNVNRIIALDYPNSGDLVDRATELASEIGAIEGVISSVVSSDGKLIYVKQKDNVIVNYCLKVRKDQSDKSGNTETGLPGNTTNRENISTQSLSYRKPNGKKALILAPFQWDFSDPLSEYENSFSDAGYSVSKFVNEQADFSKFTGRFLSSFDIIYIISHGNSNFQSSRTGNTYTGICTATTLTDKLLSKDYFNDGTFVKLLGGIEHSDKTFIVMTNTYLGEYHFDNSLVCLDACYSAEDISTTGSLFKSFSDKRAGAILGWDIDIDCNNAQNYYSFLMEMLSDGCELGDLHDYLSMLNRSEGSHNILKINAPPFFIINCEPYGLKSVVDGSDVSLSWSIPQEESVIKSRILIISPSGQEISIDVAHQACGTNTTVEYKFSSYELGQYHWYAYSDLIGTNGQIIGTFHSSGKDTFNIGPSSGDETVLSSRTYNGKKYSIIRKDESSTDCRVNGDGSQFYTCSFSVKVGNESYDIPGQFYSYETDRNAKDLGPALAVNTSTGDMWLFLIEKDSDLYYGMSGYVYKISNGSISKTTLFTQSNYGWFPYFQKENGNLVLNFFSYAGYFSIKSYENEGWGMYYNTDIYPDDFKALQDSNEIIYFL